jgi:hypothetical protein
MLSSEPNPEECDAIGDDSSTEAWLIKPFDKLRMTNKKNDNNTNISTTK